MKAKKWTSLYFTYEELKHQKATFGLNRPTSLYFTYEELKLGSLFIRYSRFSSLYFTYEELKHRRHLYTHSWLVPVCILPMRN